LKTTAATSNEFAGITVLISDIKEKSSAPKFADKGCAFVKNLSVI